MLISIHGGDGLAIAGCMSAQIARAQPRAAEIELTQWISHFTGACRVPAKLAENGRWHYRDGT
jgi:hypothetical protein